jgi:sugar (pentulose or hexulose) kinase
MLAFDFGASSGRAILGTLDNGRLQLEEMHRFSNDPVEVRGNIYWDTLRLFHEIKQGILKCANNGHRDIASIAVDTWGVDFGLLDPRGIWFPIRAITVTQGPTEWSGSLQTGSGRRALFQNRH